jgi:hypothetical protein
LSDLPEHFFARYHFGFARPNIVHAPLDLHRSSLFNTAFGGSFVEAGNQTINHQTTIPS